MKQLYLVPAETEGKILWLNSLNHELRKENHKFAQGSTDLFLKTLLSRVAFAGFGVMTVTQGNLMASSLT